ncbi:MAG: hypothetical protein IH885_07825 [Myxococcales bacterium]|nr:hypothetical protein [Myxococcales bacterium]
MPPASEYPHPRRVAAACSAHTLLALFAAAALLTLLALPGLALAWESTMDPVFVYYPRDFCSGERLALEVWKRDEQRWVKHPRHPVVPVDSCQLEDAGVLLNEIRWRCLEREHSDRDQGWSVGVRVFEPSVMQRCDVARTGGGFGETEIHVSTPRPDETISDADGNVEIEGSVWVGGLAGAEYDIVIAIDTSAAESRNEGQTPLAKQPSERAPSQLSPADPLTAQVRAARAFVETIRGRLGEVRVGIVSFPGIDAKSAGRPAGADNAAPTGDSEIVLARRELPLSDDAVALQRTLERLLHRERAGPKGFTDGLSLAIDELFRPPDWPGAARPGARRIVMLSADGSSGFPFGPSAQADRDFRERNAELARNASLRGVALHLFALGGISEEPPAFIDQMLANRASSFTRVQSPDLRAFYTDRVSMPYLERLSVHDTLTGQPIGNSSFTTDGRFAASVPLSPGENQLTVRARISDGEEQESPLVVEFDASAYKNRLLALEAARIRRAQTKHLALEVMD